MTEISRFWNSPPLGDSAEAPYDAPTEFAEVILSTMALDRTTYLSGVLLGTLDEYEPTITPGLVTVGAGIAFVYGGWHKNPAPLAFSIPTPTVATRRDLFVLRKDWDLQTIRITRLAGVEGGILPATTNIVGYQFEFPLFALTITTGGTITVEANQNRLWYPIPNTSTPEVNVWKTTTQVLPAGGAYISWNAGGNRMDVIWDVTAPTRFTAQRDGLYELQVNLKFEFVADAGVGVAFMVNGAIFAPTPDLQALNLMTLTAGSRFVNVVTKIALAKDDYVQVYAYHTSLFDLDLEAIASTYLPFPRFHMRFLRPVGGA